MNSECLERFAGVAEAGEGKGEGTEGKGGGEGGSAEGSVIADMLRFFSHFIVNDDILWSQMPRRAVIIVHKAAEQAVTLYS